MKMFAKLAATAVISLAASSAAFAAPLISGTGAISGSDTFTSNSITFNPASGNFYAGTLDFLAFNGSTAMLKSFSTATAVGTQVFTTTNTMGNMLSFTIASLDSTVYNAATPSLSFSGTGNFAETGYQTTLGSFSLTTSTSSVGGNPPLSITTFTLNGASPLNPVAVTPEPSSLMLLGTGLIGAAGTMLRRRRNAA